MISSLAGFNNTHFTIPVSLKYRHCLTSSLVRIINEPGIKGCLLIGRLDWGKSLLLVLPPHLKPSWSTCNYRTIPTPIPCGLALPYFSDSTSWHSLLSSCFSQLLFFCPSNAASLLLSLWLPPPSLPCHVTVFRPASSWELLVESQPGVITFLFALHLWSPSSQYSISFSYGTYQLKNFSFCSENG